MKHPVYWLGSKPKNCDICQNPIKDEFVDGATLFGPWANMCKTCHIISGRGVGIGKGQRFKLQRDGRWLKVEG